jgi:hypothetical protein
MFGLLLVILSLVVIVEVTRSINSPAEARAHVDNYKFHPEWGHIHYCDGTC